jgi:hypothetical protein
MRFGAHSAQLTRFARLDVADQPALHRDADAVFDACRSYTTCGPTPEELFAWRSCALAARACSSVED